VYFVFNGFSFSVLGVRCIKKSKPPQKNSAEVNYKTSGYFVTPVSLGSQYHNRSAAILPRTDEDLSISETGG
jgi:hypothetical protein